MTTSDRPISPLVANLITASLTETNRVTNTLIDSLTEQVAEARARELAVQNGVMALLDGPYMPSAAAIERALFPSADLVAHYREDKAGAA